MEKRNGARVFSTRAPFMACCVVDADWPRSGLVEAFDQALPVHPDQEEQASHHEEQRARLGNEG